MHSHRLAAALLALPTLVACAAQDDSDAAQVGDLDGLGEDDGGGGKADDANAPELKASYALEIQSTTQIRDTRTNEVTDMFLKARAHVATAQVGGDVRMFIKLCDVRLPLVSGYQPVIAPSYVSAIPQLVLEGELERTQSGYQLVTDPGALVLGAKLNKPLTDALPSEVNDPRVRDSDNDGYPGVSLSIPGLVTIYGVMRLNLALEAPVATNTKTINGAATVETTQKVLDDDSWFVNVRSMFEESERYSELVDAENKVRMKGDVTSCAGVRSAFPWAQ